MISGTGAAGNVTLGQSRSTTKLALADYVSYSQTSTYGHQICAYGRPRKYRSKLLLKYDQHSGTADRQSLLHQLAGGQFQASSIPTGAGVYAQHEIALLSSNRMPLHFVAKRPSCTLATHKRQRDRWDTTTDHLLNYLLCLGYTWKQQEGICPKRTSSLILNSEDNEDDLNQRHSQIKH